MDRPGEADSTESFHQYCYRHGVKAAPNLTVMDDEVAGLLAERLAPRIRGRTIVEVGGGIGMLSLHMARIAKQVFCIEANPMWSMTFATYLLERKPRNCSFLFGDAHEFADFLHADVAIFCTHSAVDDLHRIGSLFAPSTIDVYGEIISENPDAFDPVARKMRYVV